MSEELLKDKTLLVVDDEIDLRDILASELEFMGATVYQTGNVTDAQAILNLHQIDLVITDIRMPGGTGVDLLNYVKTKSINQLPVILITGFADISSEEAFQKGAEALICKPFKLDDLIKIVQRFSSPKNEWFTEKSEAEIYRLDSLTVREMGRGGMNVALPLSGKRLDHGELVGFSFNHEGFQFEGQGRCRWLKLKVENHRQAYAGVEFTYLTPESVINLEKVLTKNNSSSFIPSLKS